MVEARLERSQAEAKAQRAQQRLDDFLAEQPAAQVLPLLVHLHSILLHLYLGSLLSSIECCHEDLQSSMQSRLRSIPAALP